MPLEYYAVSQSEVSQTAQEAQSMYISEAAGSWFVVVNGARVASFSTQAEAQADLRKREEEADELDAIRAGFYR